MLIRSSIPGDRLYPVHEKVDDVPLQQIWEQLRRAGVVAAR
jgi:hypothetical protein